MCYYYRDERNDDVNRNNDDDCRVNNEKTTTSKSFEYKTNLIEITPTNNNLLDTQVVILLKYLSNFWRSLHFLLINCEI